jgi:hypothetical protein
VEPELGEHRCRYRDYRDEPPKSKRFRYQREHNPNPKGINTKKVEAPSDVDPEPLREVCVDCVPVLILGHLGGMD